MALRTLAQRTFAARAFNAGTLGGVPAGPPAGQAGYRSLLAFWLGGGGGRPPSLPVDVGWRPYSKACGWRPPPQPHYAAPYPKRRHWRPVPKHARA